jgi:N-acetylmuramoyl-L-alanine amidase
MSATGGDRVRLGLASVVATATALCVTPVSAGVVNGLRLWAGPQSTRVVLDLSAPAEHKVFTLSNPDRIVIDLENTGSKMTADLPSSGGFVAGMRTGDRPGGDLRVVLDLNTAVKPKSFLLEPNDSYGHRLVVDLLPLAVESTIKRVPRPSPDAGRPVLIAIDPGHGGDDPGASGPSGLREKDVVLQVARRLADEIRRQPGMEPLLIRDSDYFVPLRDRREMARSAQADLFVSIHADAFRNGRASGATVYMLSEKGATDEAARWAAERENASDLIGGVSLSDKDDLLKRVLLDLSQSATISASSTAGTRIIEELGRVTRMRKTDVQQAPFLVLKSPDIPSILIELAYISNPHEERALNDPGQQTLYARAIHAGVLDYFRNNAPPDSYLASHPPPEARPAVRHVIERGETLSEIAERYRVSVATLRQSNRIDGDRIRIGQILTIPPG